MNTKDNCYKCDCNIIHEDTVINVRENVPKEEKVYLLADFFKVFADPTRIKILNSLFLSELCVCDISAVLCMKQSAISHQLRILKQARLVKYRKEGKVVYYSLDDDHVKQIINDGTEHINENL
ncbi:MAG: ArsR/SmtB family transcription factor [Eubacteriaceae bacterium]